MKISNYIYLGIFSAFALTSCKEEDVKEPIINIQFPELKEHTMELDQQSADTIDITFDVPMKWDLTTSESKWVKFLDGNRTYSSLSGQSGKHTIDIVIQPNEGFVSDTATVDLSVAGEKKAVARIVRGNTTPTLTISLVDPYTGVETVLDKPEVALEWNETNFMYSAQLRVQTNYDWVMGDIPSWITKTNLIQVGSAGQTINISLRADYTGYTTEDMIAELSFVHKDQKDVQTTVKLQTESLIGKVRIADSETEYFHGLTVKADGTVVSQDSEVITEFDLNILSGEAIHFMAYEGTVWDNEFAFGIMSITEGMTYPEADWLTISRDEDEIYSSAAILHKRLLTFGINEGEERIAGLLAIPQSLYDENGDDIQKYIDDLGALKPEFADAGCYITLLTQSGKSGLSFAYPSEGASIRPLTKEDGNIYEEMLSEYNLDESKLNQLTYTNPAASESTIILTPGATAGFVPNTAHDWLQVESVPNPNGSGLACMIIINKEKLPTDAKYPLEGQVVLRDDLWNFKYGINVVLESAN